MNQRELQRSMYESRDSSIVQRVTLAAFAGVCVGVVWWLLFGGGLEIAGGWFGRMWKPGDLARRGCLATALSVYFVRILFTEFVFLKRGVSWTEVFTVAPWMFCIYVILCVTGGQNTSGFGVTDTVGVVLFVAGSWMNSYAEYQRNAWKQRPQNRGRLYTQGLFRHVRHPNYFGDLLSFSGLCFVSRSWPTALIPIIMLAGFVFVNVPVLDSHLHEKYGAEFDEYASRTRKLIPFVY